MPYFYNYRKNTKISIIWNNDFFFSFHSLKFDSEDDHYYPNNIKQKLHLCIIFFQIKKITEIKNWTFSTHPSPCSIEQHITFDILTRARYRHGIVCARGKHIIYTYVYTGRKAAEKYLLAREIRGRGKGEGTSSAKE